MESRNRRLPETVINQGFFIYEDINIEKETIFEIVENFIESLCNDTDFISARWVSKQLDVVKNIRDNLCNLCYLVFTQEMNFSIVSNNISFYYDHNVLQIPIEHLSKTTGTYVRDFIKYSTIFFGAIREKGFGNWSYFNFKFDFELNKSKLRYFIFCKILNILISSGPINNLILSNDIITEIIKSTIIKIKNETIQAKTTNSIKQPLITTALNFDQSILSLGSILKISSDTVKLTKTLSNPSFLLVNCYPNEKYITSSDQSVSNPSFLIPNCYPNDKYTISIDQSANKKNESEYRDEKKEEF
jgi:hypothetical protein